MFAGRIPGMRAQAMTTRTLVLGDWNPWIRDPIDVVRLLLAVAAVGFLAGRRYEWRGAARRGGGAGVDRPPAPAPARVRRLLRRRAGVAGHRRGARGVRRDPVVRQRRPLLAAVLPRADALHRARARRRGARSQGPHDDAPLRRDLRGRLRARGCARRPVGDLGVGVRPHVRIEPPDRQRRHDRRPRGRLGRRRVRRAAARLLGALWMGVRAPDPGREPLRGHRGGERRPGGPGSLAGVRPEGETRAG